MTFEGGRDTQTDLYGNAGGLQNHSFCQNMEESESVVAVPS